MMTTTTATTRIPFDDVERNFVQHKLIDPHVIGSSLTGETARYMILYTYKDAKRSLQVTDPTGQSS